MSSFEAGRGGELGGEGRIVLRSGVEMAIASAAVPCVPSQARQSDRGILNSVPAQ